MSVSLAAKPGSRERLNVPAGAAEVCGPARCAAPNPPRCGWLAIARPVQWVAWRGGAVHVNATTCAVISAAIGALPGLRVLSRSKPSTPLSAKRCCHRHTVGRLTPMRCATCCTECRSAEASTMPARSTCLRGRLRSATIAANCSRSAVLKTTHTCCAIAPIPQAMAQYRISRCVCGCSEWL
jgi:hypothetical protein